MEGTFFLDYEPVNEAVESLNSTIHEESEAHRKKINELMACINSMSNQVSQYNKLLHSLQRCVQSLEEEQRKCSEQNNLARFIKPLARKLIRLKSSVVELIIDEDDSDCISEIIEDILGDFGIEIIEPFPGDKFDPKTMKPRADDSNTHTSDLVVHKLLQLGAKYENLVLEFAQVKLTDRMSLRNHYQQNKITCKVIP